MSDNPRKEMVHGYEIKRSVLFDNDRDFALAENPNAPQPFVTWQFTEENGKRDYYWGHYTTHADTATRDYYARILIYQKDYGVSEKSAYKYYSTQRPVDIATYPRAEAAPVRIVNFDTREGVESGRFQAWGYLIYDAPLTQKQLDDYELRAAFDNPDVIRRMREISQVVGEWEEMRKAPDNLRFTSWHTDSGIFVKKEAATPEQMEERYQYAVESRARLERKTAEKKPISERLKEGAEQAAKDNAVRPASSKNTEKDR